MSHPIGHFERSHEDTQSRARIGHLTTAHGVMETPAFMPVGTSATVKSMTPRDVADLGYQTILGNTYHLFIRPGMEIIESQGGLHRFMGWDRTILTDSGGFQVWSLAKLNKITEDGVSFHSHLDGASLFLGPRESMEIQRILGSDIAMVFDECIPYPSTLEYSEAAVARTLRWAEVCREQPRADGQLVFGIGQGGSWPALRKSCAASLVAMDFDGYAIGGVSVGEPPEQFQASIAASAGVFPDEKPRYVMGLGYFSQFLDAIAEGVDMFDCVVPTRNGRNGTAFTRYGRYTVKSGKWKNDPEPIEKGCGCYACQNFSRAYVRHLLNMNEMLGAHLITLHNLFIYKQFMEDVKTALREGIFMEFKRETQARILEESNK